MSINRLIVNALKGPVSIVALFLLVACSASPPAPVQDRHQVSERSPEQYRVQKGDTLYSIAFRFGLDYRSLAAGNSIGRDFVIFPGQVLNLKTELVAKPKSIPASQAARSQVSSKPKLTPSAPAAKPPVPSKTNTVTQITKISSSDGWDWPIRGKVIDKFRGEKSSHRGIDIAGKMGDPVAAARDGIVVYAGNGLSAYGNLLIIKHDDEYLSAYAHNKVLLVGEGDRVRRGQKIAEMGNSGTTKVKLHFEIRKNGRPINPFVKLSK